MKMKQESVLFVLISSLIANFVTLQIIVPSAKMKEILIPKLMEENVYVRSLTGWTTHNVLYVLNKLEIAFSVHRTVVNVQNVQIHIKNLMKMARNVFV